MSAAPVPPSPLPDVAVVIPLYNGARWIRQTLDAVVAQTHRPREVVVVDDGSTDGSAEIARSVPGVRMVENPGRGANPARRHGQGLTTAPLLAFLDQDDLWHPDHLLLLATALAADPDAPAAVCATRNVDDGTRPPFDPPVLDVAPVDPWAAYPGTFTATPSGVLVRRAALDAVGGWPDAYVGVADFYTWLRLSEQRPLLLNRWTSTARRRHAESHSTRLREERVRLYVRNKVAAAEAALRARARVRPDEAQSLERLRDLVRGVEAFVDAVLRRDAATLAEAAARLEAAAQGGPARLIDQAFGTAFFYLGPSLGLPETARATDAFLVGSWPSSARRTGRRLRRRHPGGVRGAVRRVLRRPGVPASWQWLGAAVSESLARRLRDARARRRRRGASYARELAA